MKILYAIQGTGNGHITRAIEIIPYLQERGEVDLLISGTSSDIDLPYKVKYRFKGLSFVFGKQGGVDIWKTYWKLNSLRFLREMKSLKIKKYDLIISDFEPLSCWAALRAGKVCIGLSNQVATLHPRAPKPNRTDLLGKFILEHYAPATFNYGFHFKSLDKNIFTPVIRKEVRELKVKNKGHYTVYLPSYSDERIIKILSTFSDYTFHVFSKSAKKKYIKGNITVRPIKTKSFLKSIASSAGVICNAGFGTTSEALFLQKKLLVIPMKRQYEQHCNAAMLSEMGVTVVTKLHKKILPDIEKWIESKKIVKVNYPDNTAEMIDTIITNHSGMTVGAEEVSNYYLFQ
jgi:uncharacterized protein (TIGR00661 family)